jgi:hypothetical protein
MMKLLTLAFISAIYFATLAFATDIFNPYPGAKYKAGETVAIIWKSFFFYD